MKYCFVDSDVFVRHLRYPNDSQTVLNEKFLTKIRQKKIRAATSVFNVLEVCGILSFNVNRESLFKIFGEFGSYFGVKILFPADENLNLQMSVPDIFLNIQKKMSLGDAQIASVVERFSSNIKAFVSWNAIHFENKLPLPVYNPDNYLKN